MILEKQTQAKVLSSGQDNQSIGMSLDLDSAQVLMQMLSKNLYSDSIGSAVRECASNALDSHRRAGVTKPIIVSLVRNDSNNYEFSVEDFGTGLDHHDVENIISKYGKSTKRNSNTELGMMGLGFKAPLAYCSSFYFTCRKDGRERKYMMYEGEETNTIDLLNETVTDKSNGVKVTIPIKWLDKADFRKKIEEQLAYFENVYFNVDDIDNNFSIHRNKIFQFSEISKDKYLHICLDDVYYPLDFAKLGISKIDIPVGLRFGLSDGLFPTPNRESLIYSQEAKQIIKAKLTELANYMCERYNKSVSSEEYNITSILQYYTRDSRYVDMFGSSYNYNQIKDFSTISITSPKLESLNTLELDKIPKDSFRYLLGNYKVYSRVENNRIYKVDSNHWIRKFDWKDVLTSSNKLAIRIDGGLKGNKKSWIREVINDKLDKSDFNRAVIFKNTNSIILGNRYSTGYDSYYQILNLGSYDKSLWRDLIKDWLKLESIILSNVSDFTDKEVPKSWLDARKAKIAAKSLVTKSKNGTYRKLQGEITFKEATDLSRWNGSRKCKFVSNKMKVKDMAKSGKTYIYDSHDNLLNIDSLYNVMKYHNVILITFSNREIKHVESMKIQNFISFNNFMKGDHIIFRRISTAYFIKKLRDNFYNIFRNIKYMKPINVSMHDDINLLIKYQKHNIGTGTYDYTTLDKMSNITNNIESFDHGIYYLVEKYKKFLENNTYIDYMFNIHYGSVSKFQQVMIDLFKYHKVRVDLEHYMPEKEEETTNEE